MTDRQDAINALEKWVKNHKGETLPLAYSAVVDTLELLKEKEAVEPSTRDGANGFGFVWTCGACGKDLHPNNKKAKYCSCCGQAVKWNGNN